MATTLNVTPALPPEAFGERTERRSLAAVAGFFLSARIAVVLAFSQVLGANPRNGAAAVLAFEGVLLLLVCFHSLGCGWISFRALLRLHAIRWVIAYLLFSCCSLGWSATVSLPVSLAYWSGLLMDVLVVVLLLREGRVLTGASWLLRGYVVGACCIAALGWLMPSRPDLRLGDEEFLNSNQIGNLCAFGCFFAQYLRKRAAAGWLASILFLALTLVRTLSKTTLVAFLLSQIYVVGRDRSIPRRTKLWIGAAVLLSLLAFSGLFAAYYDVYTRAGNQADTLTGRTAIWAYAAGEIAVHPWVGHGFDSMWKVVPPFGPDRFEARHAENELLQHLYTYGIVGIVLLLGAYGKLFRTLRALPHHALRSLLTATLLFVLIRGLAEAEPFDLLLPLWMISSFALMCARGDTLSARELATHRLP